MLANIILFNLTNTEHSNTVFFLTLSLFPFPWIFAFESVFFFCLLQHIIFVCWYISCPFVCCVEFFFTNLFMFGIHSLPAYFYVVCVRGFLKYLFTTQYRLFGLCIALLCVALLFIKKNPNFYSLFSGIFFPLLSLAFI